MIDPWTSLMAGLTEQILKLDFVALFAGVGLCEIFVKQARQGKIQKGWIVPVIVGVLFGVARYIDTATLSLSIGYVVGAADMAVKYIGWIAGLYLFIRPIKYAGDWIKRRSTGAASGGQ
jgi:hypothetical protein